MCRRLFQQALWVVLAFAGLVVPAWAAVVGETALTPTLSHPMGEGGMPARQEYRITHWTAENGLPQNSIKALAQTRDGYLWIGTLKGLARFDGVRFKVFDHANTPEMKHDSINDLAVDVADGGLWIGTGNGLLHYHDHRFERYGADQGIFKSVGYLCPVQSGGVWFSPRWGQAGFARGGSTQVWEFGPDREENAVLQLGEDGPDHLLALLSHSQVLYRVGLGAKSVVPVDVPTRGPGCYRSSRMPTSPSGYAGMMASGTGAGRRGRASTTVDCQLGHGRNGCIAPAMGSFG